jgi:aspartate racemase
MRTIGLLGGLSWESTATYYAAINRGVRDALGGLHSAKIVMHSFDFAEIAALQTEAGWPEASRKLAEAAKNLEAAGAECMLICSNLMHKTAPFVEQAISVPLFHIADGLGVALKSQARSQPLLLATGPVMEETFYSDRLRDKYGINTMVPNKEDRAMVHRIIFDELVRGIISDASKQAYVGVIDKAIQAGADSVIFGCTEIGLLLQPDDVSLPVFDTAVLHAETAVKFALGEG